MADVAATTMPEAPAPAANETPVDTPAAPGVTTGNGNGGGVALELWVSGRKSASKV